VELAGYLPSNQTTKYYVSDSSNKKDITINLVQKKGNPVLYAFLCENIYFDPCYFNKARIVKECIIL
jgi:hypothetical protein